MDKKKMIVIAVIVVLALLLAYCASITPTPIEDPTEAPTDAPTAAPTQAPTEAPTVAPTSPPPVVDVGDDEDVEEPTTDPAKIDEYQQLLSSNGDYWCWMIMGCTFEEPEDISLEHLFYNGLKLEDRTYYTDFTPEEEAFLKASLKDTFWGEEGWSNAHKLPAEKVEEVLVNYLGLTLDDVTIPEKWMYFADTNAYYDVRTDAYSVGNFQVLHVQEYEDGKVEVCWTVDLRYNTMTGEYMENPVMLLTMNMQDGRYTMISNTLLADGDK